MNVLLLVADGLRRDFLGCYGNKDVNTPTLDKFSKDSVVFDQCISSAPWTPPSTASIVSGVYPHKLGVYSFDHEFPAGLKTIFDYLSENGYNVGSYVFDEKYLFSKLPSARVQGNFRDFSKPQNWMEKNRTNPFFLYIHYYWTHIPYEPQNSANAWSSACDRVRTILQDGDGSKEVISLYRKSVEYMSEVWLKGILEYLEDSGLADDTLVIFTADHGESWGERFEDKSQIRYNFILHGCHLYDEVLRVPLIVRFPKKMYKTRVAEQVGLVDITPTLMDTLNYTVDEASMKMDGESLIPLIKRTKGYSKNHIISTTTDVEFKDIAKMSVRMPEWKLISSFHNDSIEFYDLRGDPGEKNNIVLGSNNMQDKLHSILESERKMILTPDLSDKDQEIILRRLKGLGYLE